MPRKAGRGQPRVPPTASEFAKCKPALVSGYASRWLRLAAITRPSLYDWDDRRASRFSHPNHPFKVLYLADDKETAFWEVFGHEIEDMPVDRHALIAKAQVLTRQWVRFEVPAGLRIVDVTDEATVHALRSNASTWLAPYKHCHAWAGALMNHPMQLDGFIYQACRRGSSARCLALFFRPTENVMERLILAHIDTQHPTLAVDAELLGVLVKNDIDLR